MAEVPEDFKYTKSHEWVRIEDDGTATVGITDHAQSELGELVFVELPENGTEIQTGDECAVVESVKAASDIYSPLTGEIEEVNEALNNTPGLLNNDPYGDGWIYRIRIDNESELDDLLDASQYQDFLAQQD